MVTIVNPSPDRMPDSLMTATAIRYGGKGDVVFKAGDERIAGVLGLTTPLGGFAVQDPNSGTDIKLPTGEAIVGGAYIATDVERFYTMPTNVTNEPVYLGWNANSADTIIFGPDSSTAWPANGKYHRVEIAQISTDGTSVTNRDVSMRPTWPLTVDHATTADTATNADNVTATYKGNDIDNDGDGRVNSADFAANSGNLGNVTPQRYRERLANAIGVEVKANSKHNFHICHVPDGRELQVWETGLWWVDGTYAGNNHEIRLITTGGNVVYTNSQQANNSPRGESTPKATLTASGSAEELKFEIRNTGGSDSDGLIAHVVYTLW